MRIEPLFWLAAVFLGYGLGDARLIVMWVAVVLVSVLIHELGHAITLKLFGQSSAIVLHGFGGMTFSQRRLSKIRSIAVSLAGPLTALALLGIPALILRDSPTGMRWAADYRFSDQAFGLWPIVFFAAYVNIWWSIANLLPIRPLDGGNVLTELIGLRAARIVSMVIGAAAAIWAYRSSTADFQFAAFFFGILAFINFSEYRRAAQGQRAPSAFDIDGPAVPGGGGSRPGQEPASRSAPPAPRSGGRPTAPPVAPSQPGSPAPPIEMPGGIDPASAESFVWNLLRRGDVTGARRVLARSTGPVSPYASASVSAASGQGLDALVAAYLDNPSGPSNLVPATVVDDLGAVEELTRRLLAAGPSGTESAKSLQTHLQYAERFASSALVGEIIHSVDTTSPAQVAFDVACAWSRAGDPVRGLDWLSRAVDDGFAAPRLLDGEPDLAAVRAAARLDRSPRPPLTKSRRFASTGGTSPRHFPGGGDLGPW